MPHNHNNNKNIYIIVSSTGRTQPTWPLKGYAGPSGRLDVIARSMTTIRKPSELYAILLGPPTPPLVLRYTPSGCILSTEKQAMIEIARAMLGKSSCITVEDVEPEQLIMQLSKNKGLILLSEEGKRTGKPPSGKAFLLGAHIDPPRRYKDMGARLAEDVISIGPLSYHTSHVIAYLEWARLACG